MAEAEAKGVREGGYEVDLFRIPETLPQEILDKMYAPPKDASIPEIKDASTLQAYDGVLMGVPTRFGNMPAQWKTFWDATGPQWQQGAFWGKYAGLFITTGGPGEGQESTALAMMSTLAHHGFIYVPLGYKTTFAQQADIAEVRGGGPWGAGSFAVSSECNDRSDRVHTDKSLTGCRRVTSADRARVVNGSGAGEGLCPTPVPRQVRVTA